MSLAGSNGSIDVAKLNDMMQNGDYPGMLDYYTRYGVNGFQHQQMAQHYRQTIADVLKQFDNALHSDQFYLDLAWEGLNHSNINAWNNIISQSERDRIDNTIKNFIKQNNNENCQE